MTVIASILAWGLVASAPVAAADTLPLARDFSADGRQATARRIPVLVLFSRPDCSFCDQVKTEYLAPLLNDPAYRNKIMIREVDITSLRPLVTFDNSTSSGSAFADSFKISLVPTIMVFDAHGTPAAEPIVGMLIPDYYFGTIDAAITRGLEKMRANEAAAEKRGHP